LKIYWSRRLKESNLQVLCSACNHGKGSKYEDDWREPRLSVLMGERID
jgi:5-methylcytosine-specific restriction endonuclease McrA